MDYDYCERVMQPTFPPEGVALRTMKASDLPRVRTLHRDLLPTSYPAVFFIQLLVNPRRLCLVAADRDTIVGFASAAMGFTVDSYTLDRERSESHSDIPRSQVTLLTLGVLPAYQRRGIGRSLVHGVVQRLEASCVANAQPYHPVSSGSDQVSAQEGKITVLLQVQVADSNSAGKRFYAHLGMMDQHGCDALRLRVGPGSHTSVMAGVICV